MARYLVTYERDEGGWWIAELHGVPGVNSDGRTVADARRRVREALSLAIGDAAADRAELVDDVKLPATLKRAVRRAVATRTKADKLQATAQEATRTLVKELTRRYGLSVRDAADLLGVSHQRVQQLKGGRA
jgi:predicted RNase H-like HicB family nuclease